MNIKRRISNLNIMAKILVVLVVVITLLVLFGLLPTWVWRPRRAR